MTKHTMILLVAALAVTFCGCQTSRPNAPGSITHHKEARQWSFGVAPVMIDGKSVAVIVPSRASETTEQTRVVQPDNPAATAAMNATVAGTSASIPASYKPAGPATPTQMALGGLVWLGAILILLGAVGLGLRFAPWGFGKVIPVGVSVLIAAAGGLLIAYATVLAAAPWWLTALCIAAVVAVGLIVAMRDNWKKLKPVETTLKTLTGAV